MGRMKINHMNSTVRMSVVYILTISTYMFCNNYITVIKVCLILSILVVFAWNLVRNYRKSINANISKTETRSGISVPRLV